MKSIFAVSSGAPPAAIAVLRISGPGCAAVAEAFHGGLPAPRRASLRSIRNPYDDDGLLDRALVLWFPGPASATGEDLLEWHLHGGRAVIRAVEAALALFPGLRAADPGEFTRRAFSNGRIDLAEAEGLADLLEAETERQRINALRMADGELSRLVQRWTDQILMLSAQVEASIDFDDEDDVSPVSITFLQNKIDGLSTEIRDLLSHPPVERLKDGIRVVLAGPPNAGKSSLFNAILQREAAIVADIAGTTRDLIEAPISLGGIAFVLIDTAGLRDDAEDVIEAEGMRRASQAINRADVTLWLGDVKDRPKNAVQIFPKADLFESGSIPLPTEAFTVSAHSQEGIDRLIAHLICLARELLPPQDGVSANERQRALLADSVAYLNDASKESDLILIAESLRHVRNTFDRLTGRASTEAMLDALFGRFCIGK